MRPYIRIPAVFGVFLLAGCPDQPAKPASQVLTEPLEGVVRRVPWDGPDSRGWQFQTENYAVYTTGAGGELTTLLPRFMEASHKNYLKLLGLEDRKVKDLLPVYMLSNREEWVSLTKSIMGESAGPYLMIQSGGYCVNGYCVFWQLDIRNTLSVAGHEGLHQYIFHRLAGKLPMWLEEGLCTQAEAYELEGTSVSFDPSQNLSRRGDLEGAIMRGYWIPLEKLLPMDAGDAMGPYVEKTVGYYGQLWALVRFLRTSPVYSPRLDRLIRDAEAGNLHVAMGVPKEALEELRKRGRVYNQTVSEKLFRYYFNDDLSAFEKEYKAFCYKVTEMK